MLCATSEADSACHTATVLALNTAMRANEIRTLRWGLVDWQKRTIRVGRSKTEAGEGRVIPLNEELAGQTSPLSTPLHAHQFLMA